MLILLYIRNDPCVEGGESLLLDLYPIVSELKKKHPREFETLTKVPVTFQRKIMNRYNMCTLCKYMYSVYTIGMSILILAGTVCS